MAGKAPEIGDLTKQHPIKIIIIIIIIIITTVTCVILSMNTALVTKGTLNKDDEHMFCLSRTTKNINKTNMA